MKATKLFLLIGFMLIALLSNANVHTAQSVQSNNQEWQKCDLQVISNFTQKVIQIETESYTFDKIISYPGKIEGYAVNNKGEKVHIAMYLNTEYTYMIIHGDKNKVLKYLID